MAPMIPVYSSSSEVEEDYASNIYVYSTDDLDEDYVMEDEDEENSYSYPTEIPDDDVDDDYGVKPVESLERSSGKTPTLIKNPEDHEGIFSRREKNNEITSPGKTCEKTMNDDLAPKDLNFKATAEARPGVGDFAVVGVLVLAVIWAFWTVTSVLRAGQNIYPVFTVESVSVFPIQLEPLFNSTDRNLTAGWNMIFNVKNPTGIYALSYSDLAAYVVYSGKSRFGLPPLLSAAFMPAWMAPKSSLWGTVIPGFNQTGFQQDLVKVTLGSASVPVTVENSVADSLRKDIYSGASSGFSVIMHVNVTNQQLEEGSDDKDYNVRPFRVDCNLNMAFLQTGGVMAASTQECKVSLMRGVEGWVWVGFALLFVGPYTFVSAFTKLAG